MPIGPARMPLFDHLGELRRRLTIVVVSVFAAAIVLYFATPVVLDIWKTPSAPLYRTVSSTSLPRSAALACASRWPSRWPWSCARP